MNRILSCNLITGLSLAAALTLTSFTVQAGDDVSPAQAQVLREQGTILATDKLNELVLAQHPGGRITDTDLEREGGIYVYQVEVYDAQGQDWDVELNAATGEILRNERDD